MAGGVDAPASEQHSAYLVVSTCVLSYCTNTVFIFFRFILLDGFHGTQMFSARGAKLLSTESAASLEDEDEDGL